MTKLKPCPFCGNTNITGATHKPVGSAEFYEVLCILYPGTSGRKPDRKGGLNEHLT